LVAPLMTRSGLLKVSFASTSMVTGVFAWVEALSSWLSITGVTRISSVAVTVPLLRPSLSE
jgi:hypothetical protein